MPRLAVRQFNDCRNQDGRISAKQRPSVAGSIISLTRSPPAVLGSRFMLLEAEDRVVKTWPVPETPEAEEEQEEEQEEEEEEAQEEQEEQEKPEAGRWQLFQSFLRA